MKGAASCIPEALPEASSAAFATLCARCSRVPSSVPTQIPKNIVMAMGMKYVQNDSGAEINGNMYLEIMRLN